MNADIYIGVRWGLPGLNEILSGSALTPFLSSDCIPNHPFF
jgi:hypothetical protein